MCLYFTRYVFNLRKFNMNVNGFFIKKELRILIIKAL